MTEEDILNLIRQDKWMMNILATAESLNLKDWLIGAGFVRNKVWDCLHKYEDRPTKPTDVDLIYFDPKGNNQKEDQELSKQLTKKTQIEWEIVNQAYAHNWNGLPPYNSAEDALSKWVETATCVGVKLENHQLKLFAPHGIEDLINLIIKPSPTFKNNTEVLVDRVQNKHWLTKWPLLKIEK